MRKFGPLPRGTFDKQRTALIEGKLTMLIEGKLTMYTKRRPFGLAVVAFGTFALCLSCGGSEPSPTGTEGSPAGSAAAPGTGTTSTAGTTGNAAPTGAAATTGNADSSGAGATTGNTGTTDAAGTAGTAVTPGAAGSGGTMAVAGSDGGGDETPTAGGAGTAGGAPGGDTTAGGSADVGAMGGSAMGGDAAGGSPSTGAGGAAGAGVAGADGTAGSAPMDTAPTTGCGSPAGLMSGRASIDVNGKMREYILAVPDNYDPSHPYKLIFGWHPWGGSAQQIAQGGYFGLQSVIDGQAILVAPEGQEYQDNGLGWGNEGGEDIDFLHAMVDLFSSQLCIDQNRIFSTGFSFGAMFSFTLACTEASMMRAIAPMAGNATTSGRCEDGTRSVATMSFVGTDDSLLSVHRQAVQIFVERNGCSTDSVEMQTSWCDGIASSFLPCNCVEYQGCKDGYPVIECEYKAGHQFAPSAGQTLWDFFSQF